MALRDVPPPTPNKTRAAPKRKYTKPKTPLEKAKYKERYAKAQYTKAQQKRNALETADKLNTPGESIIMSQEELDSTIPTVQKYVEDVEVAFKPNPGPQTLFLSAIEQEVLYGGAAGGGKSIGILVDPLRYVHFSDFRAILFRRTNDALRELIQNSKELYPKAFSKVKWNAQKSTWTFPSGAEIWLTYLDRDDDVIRYQGQAFSWIGFDELTQWPTPYPWDYMRSRLRTTNPNIPLCMRATTNPGGVGSHWVRKMFITPATWGTAFPARDIETDAMLVYPKTHDKAGQPLFHRRFIPARLQDNPYLWEDGQYEANLLALPEAQRRQLLEGDWDVVEGAAFPEFRRHIHTCDSFEIPRGWLKFRACDWGYAAPACVLWFAVDWDSTLYVYRELYIKGVDAAEFAGIVTEMERGDKIQYGVLDSSTWAKRGDVGPSIAETMIKHNCRWRPADRSPNSRVNSKMELHRRLVERETGLRDDNNEQIKKSGLIIFNNCVNLIRTLPLLPLDKTKPEDVDTKAEDHAYDALRYGCMSRPMNPQNEYSGVLRAPLDNYTPVDATFGY
jgi:hypothetical protein